jgi:hypothetical protein
MEEWPEVVRNENLTDDMINIIKETSEKTSRDVREMRHNGPGDGKG